MTKYNYSRAGNSATNNALDNEYNYDNKRYILI